ncbi:SDR family NAD(P)-dependent oxidoreductase, partial [Frankia tisae]
PIPTDGTGPAGGTGPTDGRLDAALRDGPHSLLHLLRALPPAAPPGAAEHREPTTLLVVSLQATDGSVPAPRPERALLTGLLGSLARERPDLRVRHVDLDRISHTPGDADVSSSLDPVVDALVGELNSAQNEPVVAYRDRRRHVRRLTGALSVPAAAPTRAVFRPDRLYLVSGGAGGLGALVSRHLLAEVGARLLIVGRAPGPWAPSPDAAGTPERDQADDARADARRSVLRELARLGPVRYACLDVRDGDGLRRAVATAERELGAELAGVVHLAGSFEQRPLAEYTPAQFDAAIAAKVLGALALHRLVEHRADAVFVSFSSLNGYFGGATVGAYSAANSFLDALAHTQRQASGLRAASLAWSGWDRIGMTTGGAAGQLSAARGYQTLGPREGMDSMRAALAFAAAHVLIGLDPAKAWPR